MLQLNIEARAYIWKWGKNGQDNPRETQLLKIKASQQKWKRSLLYAYIKPGLGFLWAPLKLCQFIPSEKKAPLKSSLNLCLTSILLQDLNIRSSERFIFLLIQNGTSDFKTRWEMLILPTPALFPTLKCTVVFPAELENCKHLSSRNVAGTKGPKAQPGGGCSAVLSTATCVFWAPELGSPAPQNKEPFITARLGFC